MEERIKEIVESIKAFSKKAYHKTELLDEYLHLQEEVVNLTFNKEHAENSSLRLYHVWDHLEKLNERLGHPADEELEAYRPYSKSVSNAIRAEFSGQTGEHKVFHKLEAIRTKHILLKNVELGSNNFRTEIDAIVLTEKGIFVIEVKNPRRDIFIDERGDYYKDGVYQKLDCHLGDKMASKNILISEALKDKCSKQLNIINIIVFTNNNIEVHNTSEYLKTCFLSMLPHIIDNYDANKIYSHSDMECFERAIKSAELHDTYPLDIDIKEFKKTFAVLMATLEKAANEEAATSTDDMHETVCPPKQTNDVNEVSEKVTSSEVPKAERKPFLITLIAGGTSFLIGLIVPLIMASIKKK